MASSDFPDPLNSSSEHLKLDNAEEFLSRLADREIDRMIGPNGTRYDLQPITEEDEALEADPPPLAKRATPVQELNAQMGNFFEKVRAKELDPPTPAPSAMEPIDDEPSPTRERAARSVRSSLLAPMEEPIPGYLKPFVWISGPVLDLSPGARFAVSAISILAFAASLSALAYVLVLWHQG